MVKPLTNNPNSSNEADSQRCPLNQPFDFPSSGEPSAVAGSTVFPETAEVTR